MLRLILLISVVLAISIVPRASGRQHDARDEQEQLFTRRLDRIADSTATVCETALAALSAETDSTVRREMRNFSLFADSIIAASTDSMRITRLDSLRTTRVDLEQDLQERWRQLRNPVDALRGACGRILASARNDIRPPSAGDTVHDMAELIESFADLADSTAEALQDSAHATGEDALGLWFDRADAAKDSIESLHDLLIDREQEQCDAETEEAERASRIDIQMAYDSHYSYLGRDNGIRQSAISPSVTYKHRTGIFVSSGVSWMSQTQNHWDDVYMAVGYDLSLNDNVGCSVGYSRYWFLANSVNPRSLLNNGLSAEMSMETPAINSALTLALDFGSKNSEWLLTLTVSHPFALGSGGLATLLTEPTVTANFGEQNQQLVATRKNIAKGKKASTATTTTSTGTGGTGSVFGIMDYEIAVPLRVTLSSVVVTPSVTWILPLNVLDSGTGDPYWQAGIDLTATIR